MLRKIRIAAAMVFLTGITLLFVGIGQQWWGWMAKVQFLPSLLALNVGVLAGILIITFIVGRLYCSVICPLGIYQDLVAYIRRQISKKFKKKWTKHFTYNPERKVLRYTVLILYIICLIAGVQVIIALIAPYSAYGRMVSAFLPDAQWPVIAVGVAYLVMLTLLAWQTGRSYCSNFCPVGTFLGLISRYSLFRITFTPGACTKCGRCERGCKTSCLDYKTLTVDHSRCVDCFDCIGRCKEHGIKFRFAYGKKVDES